MKRIAGLFRTVRRLHAFSALGRAVWDETPVPEVEEGGEASFSALGRAVWDETV